MMEVSRKPQMVEVNIALKYNIIDQLYQLFDPIDDNR